MSIHLEVNENHAGLLIDFYIKRLKFLKEEISVREKETREINSQILKLKRGNKKDEVILHTNQKDHGEEVENSIPEYSDKWTWVKKIEFAITQENRPLTTKEIVDTLTEFEVGLLFERKRAIASASSVLSTKSGVGKQFIKMETGDKEFAYTINNEFKRK